MRIHLDDLLNTAAVLISQRHLSQADAGEHLRALLRSIVSFDHCVAFAYRGEERPVHIYSTFDEVDHDIFVSQYLAGPYLLDPFYRYTLTPKEGIWRMVELAPDRFYSSEYFRSYYAKTGLAEEVGYFVAIPTGIKLVVSLMRREAAGRFSGHEFALLKKASPVVTAFCASYWSTVAAHFTPELKSAAGLAVPHSIWQKQLSDHHITNREAEITQLVLQGHSSESIGLKIGISTGTVKVHRRNIYRKLGITSQTQLFTLFFPS